MHPSSSAQFLIRLLALAAFIASPATAMYRYDMYYTTAEPSSGVSVCAQHHIACGAVVQTRKECILQSDVCDGIYDCALGNHYGWDEQNCAPAACSNGATYCALERMCVRAEWRCDGTRDCPGNGEDELGCPADGSYTYRGVRYSADERYTCGSGESRWMFTVCNGLHDCADLADEEGDAQETCAARIKLRTKYHGLTSECAPGSVRCTRTSDRSSRCLLAKRVCDAFLDCMQGEDERNCTNQTSSVATASTAALKQPTTPFARESRWPTTTPVREAVELNINGSVSMSGPAAADPIDAESEDRMAGLVTALVDTQRVIAGALVCVCIAGTAFFLVKLVFVVRTVRGLQLWGWTLSGGVASEVCMTSSHPEHEL